MLRQGVTKRGEAINQKGSQQTYTGQSPSLFQTNTSNNSSNNNNSNGVQQQQHHHPAINTSPVADYYHSISQSSGRSGSIASSTYSNTNSNTNSSSTLNSSTPLLLKRSISASASVSASAAASLRSRVRSRVSRSRSRSSRGVSGRRNQARSAASTTNNSSSTINNLQSGSGKSTADNNSNNNNSNSSSAASTLVSNINRRIMRTVSPSPGPGGRSVSVGHMLSSSFNHGTTAGLRGDPDGIVDPASSNTSRGGKSGGGGGGGGLGGKMKSSSSKLRSQSQPPKSHMMNGSSYNSKSMTALHSGGNNSSNSRLNASMNEGLNRSHQSIQSSGGGGDRTSRRSSKSKKHLQESAVAAVAAGGGLDHASSLQDQHDVSSGGKSNSSSRTKSSSRDKNNNSSYNSSNNTFNNSDLGASGLSSKSSSRKKDKKDPKGHAGHRSLSPNHHLFSKKKLFGGGGGKGGGGNSSSRSKSMNRFDSSREDLGVGSSRRGERGGGNGNRGSSSRKLDLHDIREDNQHSSSHHNRHNNNSHISNTYYRQDSDDRSEDVMVAAANREAPRLSSKKKVFLRSAIRKLARIGNPSSSFSNHHSHSEQHHHQGGGSGGGHGGSHSRGGHPRNHRQDNSYSTTETSSSTNTLLDSPRDFPHTNHGNLHHPHAKLPRLDSHGDDGVEDVDCETISGHGTIEEEMGEEYEEEEVAKVKSKRGWGLGGGGGAAAGGGGARERSSERGRGRGRSNSKNKTPTKSYSIPPKMEGGSRANGGLEPEETMTVQHQHNSSSSGSNFARRSRSLLSKKPHLFGGSGEKSKRKKSKDPPLQQMQHQIYQQQQLQQQKLFQQQQQQQHQEEKYRREQTRDKELQRQRAMSVDAKQFSSAHKSNKMVTMMENFADTKPEDHERKLRSNSVPHQAMKLAVSNIQEEFSESEEDYDSSASSLQNNNQPHLQPLSSSPFPQSQQRTPKNKPSKTKINCIICRQRLHAGEFIEFSNLYFCNDMAGGGGRSSCFKCARCRCQLDALLMAKRDNLDTHAGAILDGTQVISNARGSVIQCGKCTNYVSSVTDDKSKSSSKSVSSKDSKKVETKDAPDAKSSIHASSPQDRNDVERRPVEQVKEVPPPPPPPPARPSREEAPKIQIKEEITPAVVEVKKTPLQQLISFHALEEDPEAPTDDNDSVHTSDSQVKPEDDVSVHTSDSQVKPEDDHMQEEDDVKLCGVQLTCALCSKDFSDYKGEIQVVDMNNYHAECLRRVGGNLAKNIRTINETTPAEAVKNLAQDVTVKLSLTDFNRRGGVEGANALSTLFFNWKDKDTDTVAWMEHEKEQLMLQFLRNDDSVVELGLQVVYDLNPDAFGNPNYEGFFSGSGLEGKNIVCRKTSVVLPDKLEMSDDGIVSRRLNVDLKLSDDRNTGYLLCSDHVAISLEPFPTNDDPVEKVLRAVWNLEEDGIMHEFTFSVPFINKTGKSPSWGIEEGEELDLTQAQFDAYVDQIQAKEEAEVEESKDAHPLRSSKLTASITSAVMDECDWELRAGELMGEMGMSENFDGNSSWFQQEFDFNASEVAIAPPIPSSEVRPKAEEKENDSSNNPLSMVMLPSIMFVTVRKTEAGDDLGLTLIEKSNAIIVDAISSSGKFANTDLKIGCEILSINGHRIRNPQSFYRMTKDAVGKIVVKASVGNSPPGTLYRVVKKKHMVVLGRKSDLSNTVNELGISFELSDGLIRVKEVSEYFSESISKGDICLSIDGEVCYSLRKTVNAFALANGAVALLIFPMLDMWKGMAELMVDKKYTREWHGAECDLLIEGGGSHAITLKVDEKTGLCTIEGDELNNVNVSNMNSMIKQVLGVLKDAIQASKPASRGNSTKSSSLSPDVSRYSASTAGKVIKNQSDVYKRAVAKLEKMKEDGLLSSKDYDAAMKTFKG